MNKLIITLPVLCAGLLLTQGCKDNTSAESAGRDLDRAAERAKDDLKDAGKKTGDAIKDAGDKLKDASKK